MGTVDEAIATINRAHSGIGDAVAIVYHVIQACDRYAGTLDSAGVDKPAALLRAGHTKLQNDVHKNLAATDANATTALETLRIAKTVDDLDQVTGALAKGSEQIADMRGTAAVAIGHLDDAAGTIAKIGSKSQSIVGQLRAARGNLEQVAEHAAGATSSTETATNAVAGDQDFS